VAARLGHGQVDCFRGRRRHPPPESAPWLAPVRGDGRRIRLHPARPLHCHRGGHRRL